MRTGSTLRPLPPNLGRSSFAEAKTSSPRRTGQREREGVRLPHPWRLPGGAPALRPAEGAGQAEASATIQHPRERKRALAQPGRPRGRRVLQLLRRAVGEGRGVALKAPPFGSGAKQTPSEPRGVCASSAAASCAPSPKPGLRAEFLASPGAVRGGGESQSPASPALHRSRNELHVAKDAPAPSSSLAPRPERNTPPPQAG